MIEEIPPYIFDEKLCLNDWRVAEVFRAVGNFHDAWLEKIVVKQDSIELEIYDPYFLEYEDYSMFGLNCARLTLVEQIHTNERRSEVIDFSRRDLFRVELSKDCNTIEIDAGDLYGLSIEIDPARSNFWWCKN